MMNAMEARTMVEAIKAEEQKKIRARAEKFCEDETSNIKRACELGRNTIVVREIPAVLYEEMINVFVENGYTVSRVNYATIQITW